MTTTDIDTRSWFPIARSDDAPERHVFQTQLFGYEFAVWRDDLGQVNVWENRCPHRGLRLSLGVNTGAQLRCQYHGWTFESQTGVCTHVPAHPSLTEPTKASTVMLQSVEQDGFVWCALDPHSKGPEFALAGTADRVILRSLPINCNAATVRAALADYRYNVLGLEHEPLSECVVQENNSHLLSVSATGADGSAHAATVYFLLQPATSGKTIVHSILVGPAADARAVQRHHARLLGELRAGLEQAAIQPEQDTEFPTTEPLAPLNQLLPVRRSAREAFACRVVNRREEAEGIISLELAAVDASQPLPALTAGAHLNLKTPSGLVRQYSVVNGPGEQDSITIGIKLEPQSRGGSRSMHETAVDGVVLQASVPRNSFPLVPSGKRPILIAGGIGITPLLSMASTLAARNEDFELHYFVRSPEQIAFGDRVAALGEAVHVHAGLSPEQTAAALAEILGNRSLAQCKVYACGPGPMLERVNATALASGFDEGDIHFEYFKNELELGAGQPFAVQLDRSGREFQVASGQTLLNALREQGVELEASCEQGVCGTCMTDVLSGDIEHHDLYLSASEKASGRCIMPCVSRARSGMLVLDL